MLSIRSMYTALAVIVSLCAGGASAAVGAGVAAGPFGNARAVFASAASRRHERLLFVGGQRRSVSATSGMGISKRFYSVP